MELTQEFLRKYFSYRGDGNLIYKKKFDKNEVGSIAGYKVKHISRNGKEFFYIYVHINIFKKKYALHRLIYLFHNGKLPLEIDHKDGNTLNNRILNLRDAKKLNTANQKSLVIHNTSGYVGVATTSRNKHIWRAYIHHENKTIHLGQFRSPELAAEAYDKAAAKLFGKFAVPNSQRVERKKKPIPLSEQEIDF
jgi:hypothetical protein